MFERLWHKLKPGNTLTEALRSSSDTSFLDAFQRSTVFFLHLPPGCENGFDPGISQEELLAQIRKCAKDLSERQQFLPLRIVRDNRRVLLLFTDSNHAKPFVQHYVRQVKRVMPVEVIGISGDAALKLLNGVDSVIFNPNTAFEYELSSHRLDLLRNLRPVAKAAQAGQS